MQLAELLLVCFACVAQAQVAGTIGGTVVDARTGQPLATVDIRTAEAEYRTTSDAQGRFTIRDVPPGQYTLTFTRSVYQRLSENVRLAGTETKSLTVQLIPDAFQRFDKVEVASGSAFEPTVNNTPGEFAIGATEISNLSTVLANDPLRSVQALPGVASNDDFEARFSVRGADFSRIGVYLDGIPVHDPLHELQGVEGSGSASAFNADLIQEMQLYEGTHPARFEDSSAGVLNVLLRDGGSDRYSIRLFANVADAGFTVQGPLGKYSGCSWISGLRKSYLQYLLGNFLSNNAPSLDFGIEDAQARLTCTINPKNRVSLELIGSQTDLDRSAQRQLLDVNSPLLAKQDFAFADLSWQYTPTNKLLVVNTLAWNEDRFNDRNPNYVSLDNGNERDWVWNFNASWMWNEHNPLEAGFNLRQQQAAGTFIQYISLVTAATSDVYHGSDTLAGGYLQQGWAFASGRAHLSVGGRWDHDALDHATVLSPQASLAVALHSSTELQFAWGEYSQFPDVSQLTSNLGTLALQPMKSVNATAAIEQRIGESTRLRAEIYYRRDRDLITQPYLDPRILDGAVFLPSRNPPFANSLRGSAEGIEVYAQRAAGNRLNGWVSYSYGRTLMHDIVTGDSFPSDWDQRHTVNAYASYRLKPSLTLSARWTYGSGFPIPGYFEQAGSSYYLAPERNQLRLPFYQRLDLRLNKHWTHGAWKTTLFAEALNLTNRTNYRFDSQYYSYTGRAWVSLDQMFPLLPSVGVVFER